VVLLAAYTKLAFLMSPGPFGTCADIRKSRTDAAGFASMLAVYGSRPIHHIDATSQQRKSFIHGTELGSIDARGSGRATRHCGGTGLAAASAANGGGAARRQGHRQANVASSGVPRRMPRHSKTRHLRDAGSPARAFTPAPPR